MRDVTALCQVGYSVRGVVQRRTSEKEGRDALNVLVALLLGALSESLRGQVRRYHLAPCGCGCGRPAWVSGGSPGVRRSPRPWCHTLQQALVVGVLGFHPATLQLSWAAWLKCWALTLYPSQRSCFLQMFSKTGSRICVWTVHGCRCVMMQCTCRRQGTTL